MHGGGCQRLCHESGDERGTVRAAQRPKGPVTEQRWLPSQVHLRPNSASLYASHVANHVVPLLGDRPLGALRRPDCTAFVAALAAKLAPSTVHTVYACCGR